MTFSREIDLSRTVSGWVSAIFTLIADQVETDGCHVLEEHALQSLHRVKLSGTTGLPGKRKEFGQLSRSL